MQDHVKALQELVPILAAVDGDLPLEQAEQRLLSIRGSMPCGVALETCMKMFLTSEARGASGKLLARSPELELSLRDLLGCLQPKEKAVRLAAAELGRAAGLALDRTPQCRLAAIEELSPQELEQRAHRDAARAVRAAALRRLCAVAPERALQRALDAAVPVRSIIYSCLAERIDSLPAELLAQFLRRGLNDVAESVRQLCEAAVESRPKLLQMLDVERNEDVAELLAQLSPPRECSDGLWSEEEALLQRVHGVGEAPLLRQLGLALQAERWFVLRQCLLALRSEDTQTCLALVRLVKLDTAMSEQPSLVELALVALCPLNKSQAVRGILAALRGHERMSLELQEGTVEVPALQRMEELISEFDSMLAAQGERLAQCDTALRDATVRGLEVLEVALRLVPGWEDEAVEELMAAWLHPTLLRADAAEPVLGGLAWPWIRARVIRCMALLTSTQPDRASSHWPFFLAVLNRYTPVVKSLPKSSAALGPATSIVDTSVAFLCDCCLQTRDQERLQELFEALANSLPLGPGPLRYSLGRRLCALLLLGGLPAARAGAGALWCLVWLLLEAFRNEAPGNAREAEHRSRLLRALGALPADLLGLACEGLLSTTLCRSVQMPRLLRLAQWRLGQLWPSSWCQLVLAGKEEPALAALGKHCQFEVDWAQAQARRQQLAGWLDKRVAEMPELPAPLPLPEARRKTKRRARHMSDDDSGE